MRTLFVTLIAVLLVSSNAALADWGDSWKEKLTRKLRSLSGSSETRGCCGMDHSKHPGDACTHPMPPMEGDDMPGEEAAANQDKQVKQVKDPVCSMTVDPKTAEKSVYKGKTYYFCSKDDKKAFDKEPEKYLKQEKPGKRP